MTDKKNIINPDEDFELDGLSKYVEDLSKEEDLAKDSFSESLADNNEEFPSFLSESDDFSLEDLTSDDELNLEDIDFDENTNNEDVDLTGDSTPDLEFEDFNDSSELEQNAFLSEDDDISSDEFNNLSQNSELDFNKVDDDVLNDLNMEGITELDSNSPNNDFNSEHSEFETSNNFGSDFEEPENNHSTSWDNDDSSDDAISERGSDEENTFLNDSFDEVEPVSDEEFDFSNNGDVPVDSEDFETVSFDKEESEDGFNLNNDFDNKDFDDSEFSTDLKDEWDDNKAFSDEDFDNTNIDNDDDERPELTVAPIPIPVKESFFNKIKNKFKKKEQEDNVHANSNLANGINADRSDDDFSNDNNIGTPLNATKDSSIDSDINDYEEERKKKANKANILKLSALAVIIAAVGGGFFAYKNGLIGSGMNDGLEESDNYVEQSEPLNNKEISAPNTNSVSSVKDLGNLNNSNVNATGTTLNSNQVADLKKEIMNQISTDRATMEQRISSLEKENAVLKKVINEVQTSIDPDTINRFKVEFNDLTSKTKQLQVQFDDDQASNKMMATNFYAVVKKLNDDVQRTEQNAATQNSLDEQIKRIDNSFKQLVKMKDKDAEDNLAYRVDLIEKRMNFRNPNNDRTFEDKNNVKKVLSEGLFEGDTVKQEQKIPDIKYKYSFVGMIEGVIYLKTNSGDIKDFKVGDVLPGYGEVLKINENGSLETEKQGTVSFK